MKPIKNKEKDIHPKDNNNNYWRNYVTVKLHTYLYGIIRNIMNNNQ